MDDPSRHIPFDRLADLVEGGLEPAERRRVEAHVRICPPCASEVAWLRRTIGLMRADDMEDAPPPVIARAVRVFLPVGAEPAPGPVRRVLALLRFDSARPDFALDVRAGRAAPRQLLFSAEAHDLDVRVAPSGALAHVSGQLLGPTTEGGRVELRGVTAAVQAEFDGLGEFSLPPVPPGAYTLSALAGEVELVVPGLELRA